jgi:gamma-glutamyltranspeptidase/glutathione hydrolase
VEPARKLAADGFPISQALANDLRNDKNLSHHPETRRIFQRDGKYYAEGETLRQPDLAATLARLRDHGPREFYEGETARRIAEDMKANDGLITREDLKTYRAIEREPLRGTYRGHDILTMPPPSSGGIALLEMLHILERYDLAKLGVARELDRSGSSAGDTTGGQRSDCRYGPGPANHQSPSKRFRYIALPRDV